MFGEYRADRRYTKLDPKSKRNHENGFKLVGGYILKDGKRLGAKRVTAIDTALTDDLYEKLLVQKVRGDDGSLIERERRTTQPRNEILSSRVECCRSPPSGQVAPDQSLCPDGLALVGSRDADGDLRGIADFPDRGC
jgi:hypothetical protein